MNKAGKPNSLLIELVIVLLFFSLSAVVILEVFIAAHDRSVSSIVGSEGTLIAEDIAERFYASRMDPEAFLLDEGFIASSDGAYVHEIKVNKYAITLNAVVDRAEEPWGVLDTIDLMVYYGKSAFLQIPAARYLPKEETP